jgi:hypothetical protein
VPQRHEEPPDGTTRPLSGNGRLLAELTRFGVSCGLPMSAAPARVLPS